MAAHPYLSAVLPSLGLNTPGFPMITQGQAFFVNPYYGIGDGKKPNRALTSLSTALSKITADKNDVVYVLPASNTAAYTTDYLTATLDWNKDLSHVVGVGPGQLFEPRARIAFISTYVTASNLMTVSADGCSFTGLQFYAGVNSANPTGCLSVTGSKNVFRRCHIAGIGHASMDIANAYSLRVSGSGNLFEDCVIGLDTVARGSAANSEIYLAQGCTKTVFRNCIIVSQLEHSTNSPQVRCQGGEMGSPSPVIFDNCLFLNFSVNYGFAQTVIFNATAAWTSGAVIVRDCSNVGATGWAAAAANRIYIHNMVANSNYTGANSYSA